MTEPPAENWSYVKPLSMREAQERCDFCAAHRPCFCPCDECRVAQIRDAQSSAP